MLVFENKALKESRKLPLEDIRAVIIAAKGFVITDSLIASLLDNDAVILHCNDSFEPVGWTTGLARSIDTATSFSQIKLGSILHKKLWEKILYKKVFNQSKVLASLQKKRKKVIGGYALSERNYLDNQLALVNKKSLNEATCARYYWNNLFKDLGLSVKQRREPKSKDFVNSALNYGYAVVSALCHRSAIIHGLHPSFGLHHKERYRSVPLIYDLMEPLRPFLDLALCEYLKNNEKKENMKDWSKFCAVMWAKILVNFGRKKYKFVDAIDLYISSVARVFAKEDLSLLWVPSL